MRNLVYMSGEVIRSGPDSLTLAHDDTHKGVTYTQYFEVLTSDPIPDLGTVILVEGSIFSYKTEAEDGNKEWKTGIRAEKIVTLETD